MRESLFVAFNDLCRAVSAAIVGYDDIVIAVFLAKNAVKGSWNEPLLIVCGNTDRYSHTYSGNYRILLVMFSANLYICIRSCLRQNLKMCPLLSPSFQEPSK